MNYHGEPLDNAFTACGYVGFGRTYVTPAGRKNDRTRVEINGRYADGYKETQLEINVTHYSAAGTVRELYGSLPLTREDAIKFALAILPPEVAAAVKNVIQLQTEFGATYAKLAADRQNAKSAIVSALLPQSAEAAFEQSARIANMLGADEAAKQIRELAATGKCTVLAKVVDGEILSPLPGCGGGGGIISGVRFEPGIAHAFALGGGGGGGGGGSGGGQIGTTYTVAGVNLEPGVTYKVVAGKGGSDE
jgi:hypothetical protein